MIKSVPLVIFFSSTVLSFNVLAKNDNFVNLPKVSKNDILINLLPEISKELRNVFPYKEQIEKKKRILPVKPFKTELVEGEYAGIIVKFLDDYKVRLNQGKLVSVNKTFNLEISEDIEGVNFLFSSQYLYPKRLFSRVEEKLDFDRAQGEKNAHAELADLNLYYAINTDGLDKKYVEGLIDKLNVWKS